MGLGEDASGLVKLTDKLKKTKGKVQGGRAWGYTADPKLKATEKPKYQKEWNKAKQCYDCSVKKAPEFVFSIEVTVTNSGWLKFKQSGLPIYFTKEAYKAVHAHEYRRVDVWRAALEEHFGAVETAMGEETASAPTKKECYEKLDAAIEQLKKDALTDWERQRIKLIIPGMKQVVAQKEPLREKTWQWPKSWWRSKKGENRHIRVEP